MPSAPSSRSADKRPQPARGGTSGPARFVIFVLLVVGVGAVLHHFGLLTPALRRAVESARNAGQRLEEGDRGRAGPPVEAKAPTPSTETSTVRSVPPTPASSTPGQDSRLAEAFRTRYRPPESGANFTAQLANGQVIEGILTAVSPSDISLRKGEAVIQLPRDQLSTLTQAVCYEDAFVDYMLARYREETDEPARTTKPTRSDTRSEAPAHTAAQAPAAATQAPPSQRPPTQAERARDARRVASGQMSFKEWMDKYNQDNAVLMARQKRVKDYETKAKREGLTY